jgi:prolyl oligopeptidase
MLITGDEDTRVDPLHARKMTALLQASNAGTAPILLRYHTHGGHSGSQPRSKIIAELVDTFSFLSWRTGLSLE